jgi:hypothetical protein
VSVCDIVSEERAVRKLRFQVLSETVRAEPLLGLQACDKLNLIKLVLLHVRNSQRLRCSRLHGLV